MNKSPDALPLLFCRSLSIRRPQKISANKTKSLFCPNIQLMIILPVIEKPPVKPYILPTLYPSEYFVAL